MQPIRPVFLECHLGLIFWPASRGPRAEASSPSPAHEDAGESLPLDAGIGRLLRDRSIAPGTAFADAVGAAVAEFSAEEGGGGVEDEGEGDDYMAEAGEYARHIGLPHPHPQYYATLSTTYDPVLAVRNNHPCGVMLPPSVVFIMSCHAQCGFCGAFFFRYARGTGS